MFTRRLWLSTAAAGPLLGGCGAALAAALLARPLDRPATPVRNAGRASMLGLARAGARIVAVGERGTILLSDDEGGSWRQAAAVPVSVSLTSVHFIGDKLGWAVGHQGVVLQTTDGGDRWERRLEGQHIAALQLNEAQAKGKEGALIEAQRAVAEGADKPLFGVHFVDANRGLAVGAFGAAISTSDAGKTWTSIRTRLDNPKGAHLYALSRAGQDILLAGEQGMVLHSADGGHAFERLTTPYQGSWFCAAHDGTGAWVVAGLRGNVQRSTDGGKTWNALTGSPPVGYTAAAVDDRGAVLLANHGGEVVAAVPGKTELVPMVRSASQQPGHLLTLRDGSLLISGWNGLTRTRPLAASPR